MQWRPGNGRRSIPYEEFVEECLIFGWIDSAVQTLDDQRNGLRLGPRKPDSAWSASNKRRVRRLEERGAMNHLGQFPTERWPAGPRMAEARTGMRTGEERS